MAEIITCDIPGVMIVAKQNTAEAWVLPLLYAAGPDEVPADLGPTRSDVVRSL